MAFFTLLLLDGRAPSSVRSTQRQPPAAALDPAKDKRTRGRSGRRAASLGGRGRRLPAARAAIPGGRSRRIPAAAPDASSAAAAGGKLHGGTGCDG
uniref:Uncharacterized protein n=1 Tax=Oryza sativa subsp. japonica TaxID=39947 RepID=Q652H7_ORYSJ|nr:hypothetical protein [Oryza sativa Japonica Group]BAD46290.1 hypothetical protein [Oryza sativa Japonica Group]